VIVCQGSNICGYALYVQDGQVAFHYNAVPPERMTVRSPQPLSPGRHQIDVCFTIDKPEATAGGLLELRVDGNEVGSGRLKRTLRTLINQDSFNVGCDTVSPVAPDYSIETAISKGRSREVTVTLHD
jgi:arylsulfatase